MTSGADKAEVMVWLMSRHLAKADVVQLGLATVLNQVAALLANAMAKGQGPAIEDPAALTLTRTVRRAVLSRSELVAQQGALRHFEAPEWIGQVMPRLYGRVGQFVRPLQIDAKGRINTLRVSDGSGRVRRFAGLAALAGLADIANPFLAYLPKQDTRCFVENVEFVVCDPLASERSHDPLIVLITDLAVFELTRSGARAISRHPWVSIEELRNATPATVAVEGANETPFPDRNTLRILREQVDPLGIRNIEFATGNARRTALLTLFAAEADLKFH